MNLRGVGGIGRRRVNVGWNNIVLIWEILKNKLKIKFSPTNKLIHYFLNSVLHEFSGLGKPDSLPDIV